MTNAGIEAMLVPFYSHTGRPSIDPELMIRMNDRQSGFEPISSPAIQSGQPGGMEP